MTTQLKQLLAPWLLGDFENIKISSLTLDSREVTNGSLFVALQGALLDGRFFIDKAIEKGAAAILSETKIESEHGLLSNKNNIAVIQVYRLATILSPLAYRFYFPEENLHKVIAITGTNGKTTIASLLANCLQLLGKQTAQMGTIGNGLFGQLKSSLNTTLDAISVFSHLSDYQKKNADYTLMEVSSHGLTQGRVKALPFHSAIFTNLTRDHLDYHGSMENYGEAKKSLFTNFPLKEQIINADDATGGDWLIQFPEAIAYGFSAQDYSATHRYLSVTDVIYEAQGTSFSFDSSWGKGEISAPFYGDFNVSNLAAVLTQCLAEGFLISELTAVFPKLMTVAGRMEQYFFAAKKITFVVDYAHTPDALEKALTALQKHHCSGRLICVFGCGGDRDKGKRPEMAKVAENFTDQIILVDDNPRTESAIDIMVDIKTGFSDKARIIMIHDREQAVLSLLDNAQSGDIVLLAGKGHEDYQIIGSKKSYYSDRDLLKSLQNKYVKEKRNL